MKKDFETLYDDLKNKNEMEIDLAWNDAKEEKRKHSIVAFSIIIVFDLIVVAICCILKNKINTEIQGFNTISQFENHYYLYTTLPFLLPIFIINIFIYLFIHIFGDKKSKLLSKIFKQKIISEILNNFYDNVKYKPDWKMPEEQYRNADYKEYYNRYYSDDYSEFQTDNKYNIKMAEVRTVDEETHTDSKGNSTTTRTTIFHGLFYLIELDKNLQNRLVIKNNRTMFKKDRLEMDSQEFEKYFDVSSNNKIIGMQILTSDLMELLVNYKKENQADFDIIVENNIMYLRFHTGSMFEIESIKKGPLDKELIRKYFNILDFAYRLSEQFIKVINETEI